MAKNKIFLTLLLCVILLPFSVSAQDGSTPVLETYGFSTGQAGSPFTRNLYFGLRRNPEVIKLQEFLRGLGFFTYPISNGNYLWTTVESVKKFQRAQNITPASGYFGIKTRIVANRIAAEKSFAPPAVQAPATPSGLPAQTNGPKIISQVSPYKDKIKITYVSGYGDKPEKEIIYVENWNQDEKINVTGFTLESIRGTRLAIPTAHAIPDLYSGRADDPVLLKPGGGKAIITIGKHPKNTNFQTNLCAGYFNENYKFDPSLNNRCPRIETKKLPLDISDRCIDVINSTPTCRQPDYSQIFPIDDEDCRDFLSKHFNYAGCVEDNRSRADFLGNDWYIWLGRPEEFLRDNREVIILRDREGREVDRYTY